MNKTYEFTDRHQPNISFNFAAQIFSYLKCTTVIAAIEITALCTLLTRPIVIFHILSRQLARMHSHIHK